MLERFQPSDTPAMKRNLLRKAARRERSQLAHGSCAGPPHHERKVEKLHVTSLRLLNAVGLESSICHDGEWGTCATAGARAAGANAVGVGEACVNSRVECSRPVGMGAVMGTCVGLTIGFIGGGFQILRAGPGPRGSLATLSQYMLSSGATFGFFMSIGTVLRTEALPGSNEERWVASYEAAGRRVAMERSARRRQD